MWRAEEMIDIIEYRGWLQKATDAVLHGMSSASRAFVGGSKRVASRMSHWDTGKEFKALQSSVGDNVCVTGMPILFKKNFDQLSRYNEEWKHIQKHFKTKGGLASAIETLDSANNHLEKLQKSFKKIKALVNEKEPSPLTCLTTQDCVEFKNSLEGFNKNVFEKLEKFFKSSFASSSDFKKMTALMEFVASNPKGWNDFQRMDFGKHIGDTKADKACTRLFKTNLLPRDEQLDEAQERKHWMLKHPLSKFEKEADKDDDQATQRQNEAWKHAWKKHMSRMKKKIRVVESFLGVKCPNHSPKQQVDFLIDRMRNHTTVGDFLEQYSWYFSHDGKTRQKDSKRRTNFTNTCPAPPSPTANYD